MSAQRKFGYVEFAVTKCTLKKLFGGTTHKVSLAAFDCDLSVKQSAGPIGNLASH
jgi:hypothetical protein